MADVDLRQQLLAAATQILDENGIDAVTIRETARRCGVSHGAPRRHFPSRTALLGHLARGVATALAIDFDATDGGPLPLARAYVAFAASRPHAFDLLLRHDLLEASGANLRASTMPLIDRWQSAWRSHHPAAERGDAMASLVAVHGIASLVSHRTNEVVRMDPEELLVRILGRADGPT